MNSVEPGGTLVYTKLWSNLSQTSSSSNWRVNNSTATSKSCSDTTYNPFKERLGYNFVLCPVPAV